MVTSTHRAQSRGVQLSSILFPFLLLVALAACGGGSSNTSSNGNSGGTQPGSANTGNGGAASATPKFVYALDSVPTQQPGVQEFKIDPATGVLTTTGFAAIGSSNGLSGMAATPVSGYVFVGDWMGHTITVLRVDPSSGALTSVSSVSAPALVGGVEMITDPAGRFLFASASTGLGGNILVYSIGSSGTLTPVPGSPFALSRPVNSLSIDNGGRFLFGTFDNQVYGFTIGSNGALTPTSDSPITVRAEFENPDKGPTGVSAIVDPNARFLFVPDTVNPVMYVYRIASDGRLSLVSGSPFPTGTTGYAPAVDPSGRFVFLGSFGAGQVAALKVDQSTGAVSATPGSPYDNGPFRAGGAPILQTRVDPSGKFVLFADSEETKITVFSIDQNTGALTNVPGSPFLAAQQLLGGGSPTALAITH